MCARARAQMQVGFQTRIAAMLCVNASRLALAKLTRVRSAICVRSYSSQSSDGNIYVLNCDRWPRALLEETLASCSVTTNFVTYAEEQQLIEEITPQMKRLRYESAHWDDVRAPFHDRYVSHQQRLQAISLYREREQRRWSAQNAAIIERIRTHANIHADALPHVHILDLHKDGCIRPHIDATRYCGARLAGLSLVSDSIMRLRHREHEYAIVDLHLARRSLYVLR